MGVPHPVFHCTHWSSRLSDSATFFRGSRITIPICRYGFKECVLEICDSARTLFRLRLGPSGWLLGVGRLPIGWKYNIYICERSVV